MSSHDARDAVRLRHMLDATLEAMSFASGRTRADLDHDRMVTLALVKCIEIIGEAASHVTADTQRKHQDIPWRRITGMRNRLIHAYADVDLDVVWATIANDLPALRATLERIVR